MKAHVLAFVCAFNFAKHLKALRWKTPYQTVVEAWQKIQLYSKPILVTSFRDHTSSQQHLQAHLNEFVFRFNRRFYPMTAFNSALGLAAHASATTYETLYSGEWIHPAA